MSKQKRMMKNSRDKNLVDDLKNRLNRVAGQINGISKMLDDNRYCGDILIQLAASKQALKEIGFILLESHMKHCVSDDLKAGDTSSLEEALMLSKKLN